jgi:hypothetical protein
MLSINNFLKASWVVEKNKDYYKEIEKVSNI